MRFESYTLERFDRFSLRGPTCVATESSRDCEWVSMMVFRNFLILKKKIGGHPKQFFFGHSVISISDFLGVVLKIKLLVSLGCTDFL